MQWALRRPEMFAAAASLSGALDVSRLEAQGDRQEVMSLAFGGREIAGSDSDLFHLLGVAGEAAAEQPALYVCCGTEDELVGDSRRFVAQARERGLAVTDSFGPGEHEWGYWDATIQDVLAWLVADRP
jgi:S-formylglutathione hydrolase FrmB